MIDSETFIHLADKCLQRDLCDPHNQPQYQAVTHENDVVLQVVAGPGSGKTTVIILRALYLVFVDGIMPEHILITTFTRRAARELRSRWLGWGRKLYDELKNSHSHENLRGIDLNRCNIATLDSTIHSVLSEYRPAGTSPPVVTDESTSQLILKREAFRHYYYTGDNKYLLDRFLGRYTFDREQPRNQGAALKNVKTIIERLIQDCVDLDSYSQAGDAEAVIVQILNAYRQKAEDTNTFDYSLLQELFLNRLKDGMLSEWTGNLKALLIDEYQDTNPIQETIYFSVITEAKPAVTVVGDDDQAMYRFRGGSVELFTDFSNRCHDATGRRVERVDMVKNFRSRPEIITFVNKHVSLDHEFQAARVQPPKPSIIPHRTSGSIPILGMFRQDEETLASDLSRLLSDLITKRRMRIGTRDRYISLQENGALGDIVLLSHSVNEVIYDHYKSEGKQRFPALMREHMESLGLNVFNARGQPLRVIEDVQVLLGLLLHSIDPNNKIVDKMALQHHMTTEADFFLREWRAVASRFIQSEVPPDRADEIIQYIQGWRALADGRAAPGSLSEYPVLDMIYTLVSCLPCFQSDPEHQVWLEAITRIVAGAGLASPYGMWLRQNVRNKDHGEHVTRSRESLIRDALVPIAENEVEVNEDIMPSVPRDWLQIMTIHQAKGLEFPMVIVDAGTRFKINHHKQKFLRFPEHASNVAIMEGDIEPHLDSPLRCHRSHLNRTFDDLQRLYYVAYSRAQCVLLLIGNEKQLKYTATIKNVALGWSRDSRWFWRQPATGRRSPIMIEPPFLEL